MSSHTPTMGSASSLGCGREIVPADPESSKLAAASFTFEPGRYSLVTWTVRMAQAMDRIISHTLPATLLPQGRSERLVESTLNGLDRCCRLIPARQDVIVFERARLQVEEVLATRRNRFRRFAQLRHAMIDQEIHEQTSLLYLNPVCRWIRVSEDPDSGDGESLSGSVLFFQADQEVHALRMNLEGQVLINELADYQPCTIEQWAQISSLADARQLNALAQQLAEIGLVAWSIE